MKRKSTQTAVANVPFNVATNAQPLRNVEAHGKLFSDENDNYTFDGEHSDT